MPKQINVPTADPKATIKLPELQSVQVIGARITKAGTKLLALRQELHDIAVQTMLHAEKHGDVTLAQRLCDVCGVTMNARGLRIWFSRFTPIVFTGGGDQAPKAKLAPKGSAIRKALVKANGKEWAIQEALNAPFWTLQEVEADGNRVVKLSDDQVIRMIFSNEAKMSQSMASGTFTGDAKKTAEFMKKAKDLAFDIFGSKAVAIRAAVQDKLGTDDDESGQPVVNPGVSPHRGPLTDQDVNVGADKQVA